MARAVPLFVDLDGSLVRTDVAQELLIKSATDPKQLIGLMKSALSLRPERVKRYISERNTFAAELLPYNPTVIEAIETARAEGRKVILATATDMSVAVKVADHLGLFDDIIASDADHNLKGAAKLQAIKDYVKGGEFDYIGNSNADIPIWKEAAQGGFVNAPQSARKIMGDQARVAFEVHDQPSTARAILKAMRPHQWAKNVLVFAPLFFSHSYGDLNHLWMGLVAFVAFSLCASGIYFINDLVDIEADRAHATKCKRPFAAGTLSPAIGVLMSVGLVTTSLTMSYLLSGPFLALVMVAYLIATSLYSFVLKSYSTVDVITLAILYTMRIFAGGVAVQALPSPWFMNFSLFFFLSLAYMKRYIELIRNAKKGKLKSRNYDADDADIVMTFGIANAAISVLTLSYYLNTPEMTAMYKTPMLFWMVTCLILFWISRAWLWAKRDKIDDDPVVFALKDKISRLTVLLTVCMVLAARYVDFGAMLS